MTLEQTNILLSISTFIVAITSIYVSGRIPFKKSLEIGKDVYIDSSTNKFHFIICIMNQSDNPIKIRHITFRSKTKSG